MTSRSPSLSLLSPSERRLQLFRDFLPRVEERGAGAGVRIVAGNATDNVSNTAAAAATAVNTDANANTKEHAHAHAHHVILSPPLQNDSKEFRIVVSPDQNRMLHHHGGGKFKTGSSSKVYRSHRHYEMNGTHLRPRPPPQPLPSHPPPHVMVDDKENQPPPQSKTPPNEYHHYNDDDDDDDDDKDDMFFSPLSTHTVQEKHRGTGSGGRHLQRHKESASQSSRKSKISPVTILQSHHKSPSMSRSTSPHFLTYESIQSCTALSQLIQMRTRLSLLTEDDTSHGHRHNNGDESTTSHHTGTSSTYPYLLRAIEQRMEDLRNIHHNHDSDHGRTPVAPSPTPGRTTTPTGYISTNSSEKLATTHHSHVRTTATVNTTTTRIPLTSIKTPFSMWSSETSLVMSLSTTDAKHDESHPKNTIHHDQSGVLVTTDPDSDQNADASFYDYSTIVTTDDDQHHLQMMQEEIYQQMQQQHSVLSNTVLAEMEQSSVENHYYRQKIQEQHHQYQTQQQNPEAIEHRIDIGATSEAVQQLLDSIEQLRMENERLQMQLRSEMSIRQETMQRTKQVREEYGTVLHERDAEYRQLQMTLQQTSQQQYEKQLQLQHLLHQTQLKLQSIQTDRDILIDTLQSTIGMTNGTHSKNYGPTPPALTSDPVDLHRLVLDFKKQNASQLVTIDTMKKVNEESDRMIKNAIQAKCKSENLLIKATQEQRRIMYENQVLLEQIQKLTEQLSTSKQEMESYAEMANIERVNKYKRTIEELKEQLRQQQRQQQQSSIKNAVPMNLYRSVVGEAKQYANEVQQQRMTIHTLENHIIRLEQERPPQPTSMNRAMSHQFSYPSIFHDAPSVVSTKHADAARIAHQNHINRQEHRSTVPTKQQPRPKTPLPKAKFPTYRQQHNVSPTMERSPRQQSSHQHQQQLLQRQQQQLLKSALKKNAPERIQSLPIESSKSANGHNTKVVHFGTFDTTTSIKFETTATPLSSSRRSEVSAGPTPSRLDYYVPTNTPNAPTTDSKGGAMAVTPNTGGSHRMTRSQLRLSAVRAHGGRMGLQEKLRQVRRKQNVDETKIASTFSPPPVQKTSQSSVAVATVKTEEPTENQLEGNNMVFDATSEPSVNRERTNTTQNPSKAASTTLESYSMKLERMRIRPRQLEK